MTSEASSAEQSRGDSGDIAGAKEPLHVLPQRFVELFKLFCFYAADAAAKVRLGRLAAAADSAFEAVTCSFLANQDECRGLSSKARSLLSHLPWLALPAAFDQDTRIEYHTYRAEFLTSPELSSELAEHVIRVIESAAAHIAWMHLCSVPNGSRVWAYLVDFVWSSWRCYWQRAPWRGANLGGWLLLEPGPAQQLWVEAKAVTESGQPMHGILCEHSLCVHLETTGKKHEVLDAHRKNWLSHSVFETLRDHGLNAVRIPFGYWVVMGPSHGDPFSGPALEYLDQAVDLAEEHGFQVVLDLHANPGGEQGGPPAGRRNDCWRPSDWRRTESLRVLRVLAQRYAGRNHVTGLQIANEPSRDCGMSDMCDWFEQAIIVIRGAGMLADQAAVVLPVYEYIRLEEFVVVWGGRGNFLRFENIAVDVHYYHVFWKPIESLDYSQHIEVVNRHGKVLQSLPGAVVGEWSLSTPSRLEPTDESRRQFGDAQLQAYSAASHGWFFWNYCDAQDEWDLRTCAEKGWLPRQPGAASSADFVPRAPPPGRFPQCYGSEERRMFAEFTASSKAEEKRPRTESNDSSTLSAEKRPRTESNDET